MRKIFVSYSQKDSNFAAWLVDNLEKAGFEVWIDKEKMRVGQLWRRNIIDGISEADAVIIVISKNSKISRYVRKELDIADQYNKHILPIRLDAVDIPEDMQLQIAGIQYIDFKADHKASFKELLKALAYKNEGPVPVPPVINESNIEPGQLKSLREKIVQAFSLAELELLCGDIEDALARDSIQLPVNLDIIGGHGKESVVLNLINFFQRRGYLFYLIEEVKKQRPGLIM